MKTSSILVAVLSVLAPSAWAIPDLVIRDVTIVDVRSQRLVPGRDVIVQEGRIVAIKPHGKSATGAARETVDGRGMFLTPGLIDAHVHLDLFHWERQDDGWSFPMYLSHGVTAVRDAAGSSLTRQLKREVARGELYGPRMVVASPFITSDKASGRSNSVQVKDPQDAIAWVDEFLDRGFDMIKVGAGLKLDAFAAAGAAAEKRNTFLFGHALAGTRQGYPEIYLAESLAGMGTIEHLNWTISDFLQRADSPYYRNPKATVGQVAWYGGAYMDFDKLPALADLIDEKRGTIIPTMIVMEYDLRLTEDRDRFLKAGIEGFRKDPVGRYLPDYYYDDWAYMYTNWSYPSVDAAGWKLLRKSYENQLRALKALDDAGVPLPAGTDAPARPYVVAGKSLHDELAIYRQAGISSWRALRAGTLAGAIALDMEEKLGEVRPGAFADLVLTKKDPIRDPSALRKPDAVVSHGEYLPRAKLDRFLEAQRKFVRTMPRPKLNVRNLEGIDAPRNPHRH